MSLSLTEEGLIRHDPFPIQKGYGHVYGASNTADLAMSYANVDAGSAPAAGDLVVWLIIAADNLGDPVVNLTGSGWTQGSLYAGLLFAGSILAKVVAAGDISSPPTVITTPTAGSIGFWAAFTPVGTVSSLSASTPNVNYSGNSAPANQGCDSSGIATGAVAITLGGGGGDDGSPTLSMSGATASIDFASATNAWAGGIETRFQVNVTVGGANITFSKSDDGGANHMVSGFITVS